MPTEDCTRVIIVLPERASDQISQDLRRLSALISHLGLGEESGGLLGGQHGYGTDYENDVFLMHHFCWCDQENCPWCAQCTCPESAFHYLIDNKEVTFDEWDGIF